MAVTKILYRNGGLQQAIDYITYPAKTNEQLLTDYVRCDPGYAAQQMMDTKRALGKIAGRQCYHIIQSFKPDEITPELAHEIARQFAAEHLPGYEAVIATHVDKTHKLLARICGLSRDLRFDELRKVLESYGYEMRQPNGGSSHCTFRKPGCAPITIPMHEPIKKVYVMMVKEVVESEVSNREDD